MGLIVLLLYTALVGNRHSLLIYALECLHIYMFPIKALVSIVTTLLTALAGKLQQQETTARNVHPQILLSFS